MSAPSLRVLVLGGLAALVLFAGQGRAALAQTIALVQINQQALFFNEINRGAQEAADAAGAELVIFNANDDPAAQNNAIETYIAEGVDALIVVAIDVNGIMPAVQQAADAGIPVFAVDAILPAGPQKAQIGVDNVEAATLLAESFVTYVDSDMEGSAQLGIVGALNSFIQNERQRGFEEAIAEVDGVETLGVVDGRNVQDAALSAAENLITANPTLNAIYATGEPALIGAVAATEAQGATDRVRIFGWDLTAQAIAGIDAGYVVAVVQQDPAGMGKAAVEAAKAVIDGGGVEPVVSVPVTIVTKANVDDYRALFD
ncbi:substrate-binding domain-containing protein [Marinivivus vitaminiproducens]|uniref:substrate-binding domain-containing protein n=1 Tax=Marinivivus vitaminiproducens TaxID=3035935 RepID=UPI00279EB600|nr:substrate-binding domain-containing protein [Geminicoccaceae bacterium SCSIO 64248]